MATETARSQIPLLVPGYQPSGVIDLIEAAQPTRLTQAHLTAFLLALPGKPAGEGGLKSPEPPAGTPMSLPRVSVNTVFCIEGGPA